jgi:hypothetical protein
MELIIMETERLNKPSGVRSLKRTVLFAATLVVILGAVLYAILYQSARQPVEEAAPVSTVSDQFATEITTPQSEPPLYHKKLLVYKRPAAETDRQAIRASARTDGYQALAFIPPAIVAPQNPIRAPQFLSAVDLTNYQALSTLGTQVYYQEQSVQQFLTDLSARQTLGDLSSSFSASNLKYQQYLTDLQNKITTNNLYYQQYLNDFNFRMSQSNLNFQQYLSNLNLQQFQNRINIPSYTSPLSPFTSPTITQPNIYTPPVQLYTPPIQNFTQPNFYIPPVHFYNPPPTFNFP